MRVPPHLGLLLLLPLTLAAEPRQLTVDAGAYERHAAIVPVPNLAEGPYVLRDEAGGGKLPLDGGADAAFVLPALKKGERKTYTLEKSAPARAAVHVRYEDGVVKVSNGDKPVLNYQAAPGAVPEGVPEHFQHGAHIHPAWSPSGRIVTGNHPPDHRWHRGIWFSWTTTEFEGRKPDFWNMGKEKGGKFTGEIRFARLKQHASGAVRGVFEAEHRWLDHTGGSEKEVLKETWRVVVTPLPHANVIDLTSTQTVTASTPLKLPKYHYGGLGVRGPAAWDEVDQVTMLTSEGLDRKAGDSSTARWVQMSGEVDGKPVGLAVLIHPENFRFPQPLRLNPKNPQLCVAPSQGGDWAIEPGQPYVSKYRFVVTDGPAEAAMLERAWNDYAKPPVVTLQ